MRQWEKIASGGKYGFLSSSVFECVYQTWSPFKQVLNRKNSGAFHHEPPPPPVLEEAVLLSCRAGLPGFAGVSSRGQPEKWAGRKDMCEELYCE